MEPTKKKWLIRVGIIIVAFYVVSTMFFDESKYTPKVAVIRINGVIVTGENSGDIFDGEVAGADTVMRHLRYAADDESVKAVLIRIDSPGGSAAATQEIAEEMGRIREAGKPIVVSMGDMAASGGYWIASEGDTIFANPATITGSIGVYMEHRNLAALYEKVGIANDKIKSGPLKDMMSSERPLTEQERGLMQAMVDDMYNQFLDAVINGRKMTREKLQPLADGRIFTGRQAKEVGLVDHLGNYYDALDEAAYRGGIDEENPTVVEYDDNPSLWNVLFKNVKTKALSQIGVKNNQEVPQPRMRK